MGFYLFLKSGVCYKKISSGSVVWRNSASNETILDNVLRELFAVFHSEKYN